MDITKPYKFIGFGAMDVTKPHKFIRFWGHVMSRFCLRCVRTRLACHMELRSSVPEPPSHAVFGLSGVPSIWLPEGSLA